MRQNEGLTDGSTLMLDLVARDHSNMKRAVGCSGALPRLDLCRAAQWSEFDNVTGDSGMTRIAKWVALGLVAAVAVVVATEHASARPNYCKTFIGHYTGVKEAAEAKCGICHPGTEKKEKNNYGQAFGKALGAKNEKDEAKIKEALIKAEGEKSAVDGKTFGDLLKAGKLPASK